MPSKKGGVLACRHADSMPGAGLGMERGLSVFSWAGTAVSPQRRRLPRVRASWDRSSMVTCDGSQPASTATTATKENPHRWRWGCFRVKRQAVGCAGGGLPSPRPRPAS
jgi:hypothetical protein